MGKITSLDSTMGKIIVTLTLTNMIDKDLSERGFITAPEIRSCTSVPAP